MAQYKAPLRDTSRSSKELLNSDSELETSEVPAA